MKYLKTKYEVALKILLERLGLDEITRMHLIELVEEIIKKKDD